ncbi:endonuclease domain-containing protein [Tsukamurella strandjordii]|uniref:DUF559 domain-containing protein n=1 Tax=Tsukamurella strandjordii TaxID=147577 RepID=A0AA90SLJ5_9ACTN|nr:hypothetical protein [Tsukamurella strandjordii]MDP0398362.1 hypothetical protein [Tsukamurella strandjordii]
MDPRNLVAHCAAADGGVVSRRRLVREGIDGGIVDDLRRRGDLRLIRRGWYHLPGAKSDVVEVVHAGAVLTCVSALEYRTGVWIPPRDGRLHVRWSEHRSRPRFRRQCRSFHPMRTPTRAVDPLNVALTCAANCLPADLFVAVLDSTLRMPVPFVIEDLRHVFGGAPERVTRLLDRLDPQAGSGTESITRFRLQSARIQVRSQVSIPGVGRVDLLVGDKLIIECDSESYHGGAQRRADIRRDRTATVGNYRILRVDYNDVMGGWDEFFAEVADLVRRGRHRGAPDF